MVRLVMMEASLLWGLSLPIAGRVSRRAGSFLMSEPKSSRKDVQI
jgi:hypothetical protein